MTTKSNGTETIRPATKRYALAAKDAMSKLHKQVNNGERCKDAKEQLPEAAFQSVENFCSLMWSKQVKGDYRKDNAKEAEELAAQVMSFVHNMTVDKKAFIDALQREHRTLHQNFMELVLAWLVRCAKAYQDHAYDARNEATCKMAHRMVTECLVGSVDQLVDAVNNNRRLLPFI